MIYAGTQGLLKLQLVMSSKGEAREMGKKGKEGDQHKLLYINTQARTPSAKLYLHTSVCLN